MTSYFSKLFQKKKPRKGPHDNNQSMIDFIAEDSGTNDSFRSHQPHLDTSLTDLDSIGRNLTEASPTLTDHPIVTKSRANITSVFNTPKRASLVEDLYDILQEHVIDQLGEMILYPKKAPVSTTTIIKAYEKYRKINASRLQKAKGTTHINVVGNLLKCYEMVPSQYFDDEFVFNFEYLTQDKAKVFDIQEKIGDYLDLVEENLYYQITDKFQAFLDVILKLNQMEVQINNSLQSIKFIKSANNSLKGNCAERVEKTLRLKRRKINIEKTLALMELINVVKKTLPTLVQLIQRNNIESAVKLVKTSEDTYKHKLNNIKALKNFHTNFNEARNTLEKMLTSEFEERCINYLSPAFSYNKSSQHHHNMSMEVSMVEESFMNVSTVDFGTTGEEESPGIYQLYWTLNDYPVNQEVENQLCKIVLEYIKIKHFNLTSYKARLFEFMKKIHKQFIKEMNEYIENMLPKEEQNSPSSSGKFDLNIKFTLFYFEFFKRFLSRHLRVNNKILSSLIEYYNMNYAEKEADIVSPNQRVLDVKAMKTLNETVQEFYLAFSMIFKHFVDKFTEIISMNNVEHINITQFAKLRAVFEEILNYFNKDLKVNETINSWIVTNKDGIKKPLNNLVSTLTDKFSITSIQMLKTDYEKRWINLYSKKRIDELRQTLEQESWQPADIPYTYGIYFNTIFGIKMNKPQDVDLSIREDLLKSSRPFSVNDTSMMNTLHDEESVIADDVPKIEEDSNGKPAEEIYSIKKNEIFVGEQRFKATGSFLLLVKMICDNYNLALKFSSIESEAIAKLFETLKFYNSYSIQLILGAGATTFGKVKKITAKTLALSSVSLSLLLELIDPLYERIKEQMPDLKQEWLSAEIGKIKNDLKHHINEITSKIRSILKTKLIEQCNELKKMNWANTQEKINIPTKHSASILHNTRQIYKTIEDYLSKENLIEIFNVIFSDIKDYYLPIFQATSVESKLAAKRLKEELKYFCDDLYQIPIFQVPELKYADFEDKIFAILEEKCNHFLEATALH